MNPDHSHAKMHSALISRWIRVFLMLSILLAGCAAETVSQPSEFLPLDEAGWEISSPAAEGLDPGAVAKLYRKAGRLESIYSLLIIKNGKLVAEQYFHEGSIDLTSNMQSVTKSVTSALVGLACEQGCLPDLDQPMLDYFPENGYQVQDPRKFDITVRQLLQMRAGYPWEESHPDLWAGMLSGDFLGMMVYYPLATDPGTAFHYSNVSSHYLGAIVSRACQVDLEVFAAQNLFDPLGMEPGDWYRLEDGYPMGNSALHLSARDAARFGLLYLNRGSWNGVQILPADWVEESLQTYSEDAWTIRIGRNMKDFAYGYQWWTVRSGSHIYHMAWGHGGQVIALLDEYDMVIVLTADPFWQQHDDNAWRQEKANLNLVGNFIASLPSD